MSHDEHHEEHAVPATTAITTPTLGGSPKFIGWIITGAVALLLLLFLFIWKPWKSNSSESENDDTIKSSSSNLVKGKKVESTPYTLTTNEPMKFYGKQGYRCEISQGSKKIYFSQNGEPEVLWYPGTYYEMDHNLNWFTIRKYEGDDFEVIIITYIPE
jgi:hypothetical protein